MPRYLTIAASGRKQTLADDPVEMEGLEKKKMKIGRFVQHPHHIHTAHTTQHTLHNSINDMVFELAKGHTNSQQFYCALQVHTVSMWEEVMYSQPMEGGMVHFGWRCLEPILAVAGVMKADEACQRCMLWIQALIELRPM